MLSVGFVLQWILCLNLICKTRLVISGFTIYFYIKLSHDLFEINDFVQYQSSLFAHFAITNYHLCRFYYDCDQSQIDLVTILYELILAPV
jgi:hypothetical protein